MRTRRSMQPQDTRNAQLIAFAGVLSGLIFTTQLMGGLLLRWDRFQHVLLTLFLFFVFHFALSEFGKKSVAWALGASFLLGLCKEIFDPQWQSLDLVANIFGLGLALLLIMAFQALWMGPKKRLR